MKVVMVLLALIAATHLSGAAAVKVKIRAYNATRELDLSNSAVSKTDPFIVGTRILLICNETEQSEGIEVVSYRWFRSCKEGQQRRCEIRDGDPYYRVVSNTLLVDVTSWNQGGRYYCTIHGLQNVTVASSFTPLIIVAGNPAPFLYTPTSLLPEHSVLTDVQQATGRNEQQWITCSSGGQIVRPKIWMGTKQIVSSSSTMNSSTIGLGTQRPNGVYHCFISQTQTQYFSLYLRNSASVATPTVRARDSSMWTLTSPDGSQVERYIVELECRVRNMTFVEKYVSVSVSRGTGQVATSVSCFGGLGQLYRVTVWAVNGPNISQQPAVKCLTPDEQCMMEGSPMIPGTTSTRNDTSIPSSSIPSGTPSSSPDGDGIPEGHDNQVGIGTFIGVGVGVGILLLIVVLALVGVIVVVVMVKRRAANKQMESVKMKKNPSYYNPVAVEMAVKGLGHDYEDVDKDKSNGSIVEGFDPYKDVDSKPALKESSTPASDTNVGELYAVVDKSKKKGTKQKQEEDECTVTNKDELYTVPMNKKRNMTDEEKVVNSGAEKGDEYDDVIGLKYVPKVDSEPQQSNGGDNKAPNAHMLYAVVDKSHKKKK